MQTSDYSALLPAVKLVSGRTMKLSPSVIAATSLAATDASMRPIILLAYRP